MAESRIRTVGLALVMGVLGATAFAVLYDRVAPAASVDLRYSRREIMEQADNYLTGLGFTTGSYQQDAWFGFQGDTHLFLQTRGGVEYANRVIRSDSLSIHHWYVSWYDRSQSRSQARESFELWMSPAGRVLGFQHVLSDTATLPSLTRREAQEKAEAFLTTRGIDFSPLTLQKSTETKQSNRLDHRFVWGTGDTLLTPTLWVTVLGNEIGGYRLSHEPKGSFLTRFSEIATMATFLTTSSFAVYFLLFFYIIILFLRKYHEGEVGTRTALLVFIGLFAVQVLATINEYPAIGAGVGMGDLNRFNVRMIMFGFTVFIFHTFSSVMVFAAWSVGESSSRAVWPRKMAGVDSILYWKLNTLDVAEGILRGYGWGLVLLGGYAVAVYALVSAGQTAVFTQGAGGTTDAYVPALRPFLAALSGAVIVEIIFRLFFVSYLKEKTRRVWISVAVSTILMAATTFLTWDLPFGYLSFWWTVAGLLGFGVVLSLLYLKYDLLTTMTANFVIIGLTAAIPLFSSSGEAFGITRWAALALLALPLAVAVGGFVTRTRFEFTPQTLPPHILRITERERMAKELEIARKVQMSLLPKTNPVVEGFDIAGICIPALEVGGDYYDFVTLGGRKIGIAIGDVSGKGVPAAIYMTLTKGILQSHAEDNVSPRRVLSKVNSLMYRTIDRNSFVSMFYAILDPDTWKIRFARAGQCPVIVAQRTGEQGTFLTPRGIALGLEMGKVFDSVIEEQELEVQLGDVLVFYTDGFTEARTTGGEEFGEERLVGSISRHREKSATGIIRAICDDVQSFTSGHPQHDDMTMVVVKAGGGSA